MTLTIIDELREWDELFEKSQRAPKSVAGHEPMKAPDTAKRIELTDEQVELLTGRPRPGSGRKGWDT